MDIWNNYKSLKDDFNRLNEDYKACSCDISEIEYATRFNIASKIKGHENIHIMYNDKFNGHIINIFNRYFDPKKHFL